LLSSRIEHHVGSIEDGRLLMSFPRAGRICAAQILAELWRAWQDRKPYDPAQHRAAAALLTTTGG
jgi:transposase